jgi:hypothetical protein
MVKQSLEKRLTRKQTQSKSLTSPEISIPPHPFLGIGTSQGFWQLNWLHLTEQTIIRMERIKTRLRSMSGHAHSRPDERMNPSDSGRTRCNYLEVFSLNQLE